MLSPFFVMNFRNFQLLVSASVITAGALTAWFFRSFVFAPKQRNKTRIKLYWFDNFRSKRCEWLLADDKILGEKTHYYCSSSEDEGNDSADDEQDIDKEKVEKATFYPEPKVEDYNGTCTNTGPKGVLNDWREFKRLETEKRESQEQERQQLIKKLSMTCRSHLNDDEEKKKDDDFMQELEDVEDEFIRQYRMKRIEEMRQTLSNVPKFGKVIALEKNGFIDAIDKENPSVKIVVHIYEQHVEACEAMNGCLACLAKEYPNIKFCKIRASDAKLSKKFSVKGVPALLVYKKGDLIANHISLSEELGDDFYATDVESYLQEHGILPLADVKTIRDKNTGEVRGVLPQEEDEDECFDLD